MSKATEPPRRKAVHLRGYDYANPGYYFVTVCAHNKRCLFGEIDDGEMRLNETGQVVAACWSAIPDHYPSVGLDQYVVMPNHLHGIVSLGDVVGARHASPLQQNARVSLGTVIGSFKSAASKQLRLLSGMNGLLVWQRNYHEHVIRTEISLQAIREYIINNPAQWALDKENPAFSGR